jgi:hypothetical protein
VHFKYRILAMASIVEVAIEFAMLSRKNAPERENPLIRAPLRVPAASPHGVIEPRAHHTYFRWSESTPVGYPREYPEYPVGTPSEDPRAECPSLTGSTA